eukprot:359094-Chlamydomonas_euryale.AAC.13
MCTGACQLLAPNPRTPKGGPGRWTAAVASLARAWLLQELISAEQMACMELGAGNMSVSVSPCGRHLVSAK